MNIKFAIGAPSLTGKGANEDAEATIKGMEFPCSLYVTNHMPRAAVFPESGIELASAFASAGQVAEVMFASATHLKRLMRSASEVAELNGYELALTISDSASLQVTDEELTEQVIEQAPELREEVEAAGGVDAAATLAEPATDADGRALGTTTEAPAGEGEKAPAVDAETNTDTDGEGAGGEAADAGDTPAPAAPQAETPKAGGKKSKAK